MYIAGLVKLSKDRSPQREREREWERKEGRDRVRDAYCPSAEVLKGKKGGLQDMVTDDKERTKIVIRARRTVFPLTSSPY